MKIKHWFFILFGLILAGIIAVWSIKNFNLNKNFEVGQEIDRFNDVPVFYNGGVSNISGRNLTKSGYNLGMNYQCVEFVKRYYYEYLNHQMPNSYGNAKDFFDPALSDGQLSTIRNLNQYTNSSNSKPQVSDLLIFDGTILNRFGHVAIITKVSDKEIEIIQQNPGLFAKSRETFKLENINGKWEIKDEKILGWLRKR